MTTDVSIIQPYSEIRSFETPDEFRKYYANHKDEIDVKTTNQLNKEFTIPGFKITRRNIRMVDDKKIGDLHLKPTKITQHKSQSDKIKIIIQGIVEELDQLKLEVKRINDETKMNSQLLTEIIAQINS